MDNDLKRISVELEERLKLAKKTGCFFVTITRKEGDKLTHSQCSYKFPDDDLIHSLNELKLLVKRTARERGKHLSDSKANTRTFH